MPLPTECKELTIVNMGYSFPLRTLKEVGETVLRAFDGAISKYSLSSMRFPSVKFIDAILAAEDVAERVGGNVLGFTDVGLLDGGYEIFAARHSRKPVALVSSMRLAPSDGDYSKFVLRLAKEALHELGHGFGLVHHYDYTATSRGNLCPMSKGRYNKFGEAGYVKVIIDSRDTIFCSDCRRFVERIYGRDR